MHVIMQLYQRVRGWVLGIIKWLAGLVSRVCMAELVFRVCMGDLNISGVQISRDRARPRSYGFNGVPSETLFLLATVNQAPSPALRTSNMVSHFNIYEEPW